MVSLEKSPKVSLTKPGNGHRWYGIFLDEGKHTTMYGITTRPFARKMRRNGSTARFVFLP
jgi:hypothetical protein